MRDPSLEAFVVAIERHLSAQRGREHTLSPPDFALAREWMAAGVPLAAVLAGIDQAFEKGAPASLGACRRFVRASTHAGAGGPALAAEPAAAPVELRERLAGLEAALGASGRPAAFERASRRLRELIDLASVAREPNWPYLRDKLLELDSLVELEAVEALSAPEAAALGAEAERAAERQLGRAHRDAIEAARERHLRRRARERFALPRVGGD